MMRWAVTSSPAGQPGKPRALTTWYGPSGVRRAMTMPRLVAGEYRRGSCMPEPDRAMGERLHAVIKASAPALSPRLWYGMPAYAKDGNVVCFFQSAQKFKTRYTTLGFSDKANLDEGAMWPTTFALTELTTVDEARIGALVKQAVS
jgi:uncharacterized protein YdhG (YjbR/CyaY superfamily)